MIVRKDQEAAVGEFFDKEDYTCFSIVFDIAEHEGGWVVEQVEEAKGVFLLNFVKEVGVQGFINEVVLSFAFDVLKKQVFYSTYHIHFMNEKDLAFRSQNSYDS